MDYVNSHLIVDNPGSSDYSWLCGLMPKDRNCTFGDVADAFHIVLMIEQSMFTNDEAVYQKLLRMANDGSRRAIIMNACSTYLRQSPQFFAK